MNILVAAGGTGGHITPGIAIANMLKDKGHNVTFVGTERGLEKDLVPKAGYDLKFIHAEGIRRGSILKNFEVFATLAKGIKECKKLIKEMNIDMVIGTGGYVTAPLIIAGNKLKVPTFIHESNALPGKTTIWLSKKTDCIALGFEDAKKRLPHAKNAVFTGNPTKIQGNLDKNEMKKKLGYEGKTVLVFGGSQGAKKINETMIEMINENKDLGYHVIYATGPKNYDDVMSQVKVDNKNFTIEKYIYNMQEVMAASDLAICRSGALTVTEIEIMGVPSIMIPFPHAAENHQYFNAKTLADKDAGVIIEEKDLSKENLEEEISKIIFNEERLKTMAENTKKLGDSSAITRIEKEIENII